MGIPRVFLVLALLACLPAGARAAPSAPELVRAWVQETSGDLFLDSLRAWWRPVRGEGVARYRVRWSPDPAMASAPERLVTHNETAAWIETTLPVSPPRLYHYQTIHFTVEALDGQGTAGPAARASALAGERPSLRGDANDDGSADLGDAIALLSHLFQGGFRPSTYSLSYSCDANGDRRVDLADALFVLAWLFLQGPAPVDAPGATARPSVLQGMFYGENCPGYTTNRHLAAVEAWQSGKKLAVVNLFSAWTSSEANTLFNTQLPMIWSAGCVPMISWQPHPTATSPCVYESTPADIEVRVASGQNDAFIRDWAGRLKTWLAGPDRAFGAPGSPETADDRRAYLRLAHEMNGWWVPWNAQTGNNSPADYVAMWQRVHGILTGEFGLDRTHLQWVWCVNNVDADTEGGDVFFPAERYYPGHDHVDWLSIDGYNWGFSQSWTDTWTPPLDAFNADYPPGRMISRLKALAPLKPISIAEYGTSSVSAKNPTVFSLEAKNAWISDALSFLLQNDVRMVLYFNLNKETDWPVFGGPRGDLLFSHGGTAYWTFTAYQAAMRSPRFLGTQPGNRRLLTDEEFAGAR